MKAILWRDYVDDNGDFELPHYLYTVNKNLMKEVLDIGTMLSTDATKLRAFKEHVKKLFKNRWMEIADALEFFDMVVPCVCSPTEYCEECGGSRYLLNEAVSPDRLREINVILGFDDDSELVEKLSAGLRKALREVDGLPLM